MSPHPPYYSIDRRLSPNSQNDLGLFFARVKIKSIDGCNDFAPRSPDRMHVTTLASAEFGYAVRAASAEQTIHKLPPATWKTALEGGMQRRVGSNKPLDRVRVEGISLLGRGDQVALLLNHGQLDQERMHAIAMMEQLGGVALSSGRTHLTIGTLVANHNQELLNLAKQYLPSVISLEPVAVSAVPSLKIDARLDRSPPHSALIAVS